MKISLEVEYARFCAEMLRWTETGVGSFSDALGLCGNLHAWTALRAQNFDDESACALYNFQKSMFIRRGLDQSIPFNEDYFTDYMREKDRGDLYYNPRRLDWLREHAGYLITENDRAVLESVLDRYRAGTVEYPYLCWTVRDTGTHDLLNLCAALARATRYYLNKALVIDEGGNLDYWVREQSDGRIRELLPYETRMLMRQAWVERILETGIVI